MVGDYCSSRVVNDSSNSISERKLMYVPATKELLIEYLTKHNSTWKVSYLRKMSREQLLAIYLKGVPNEFKDKVKGSYRET